MATTAEDWSLYYRIPIAYGEDAAGATYQKIQVDGSGNVIAVGLVTGTTYAKILVDSNGYILHKVESGTVVFEWTVCEQNNWTLIVGNWVREANVVTWEYMDLGNTPGPAQNDAICIGHVFIPASGTYTIYIKGIRSTSAGNYHVLLNNSDVANINFYAGTLNANYIGSVSLGTLSAGLYTVVLKVSDNSPGSGNYDMVICSVKIVKT